MKTQLIGAALLLAVTACSSSSTIPEARYANAPVATIVDDRRDIPKQPEQIEFLPDLYLFKSSLERVVTRPLELHRKLRALGVNALDNAPDSTWFTNRIGTKPMTPEDIERGPVTHDPMQHLPWTIESTKTGGTTAGFVVKDTAGVKYLLKFDYKTSPGQMETGTHIVVNRLMFALGYNVAEDQIVYLHHDDLKIGKGAKHKDILGDTIGPLEQSDVDTILATVRTGADGGMRTLASRWIEGKVLGGHASEGRREDDPNDRIPHEARRDLRGMRPIDAWTDSVDVTEGQFVDTWQEDPVVPKRHYIKHYAIDFGKSLGAMGQIDFDWYRSHAYRIDFPSMFHELFTLGITSRPWEVRADRVQLEGVSSLFDVESFDPEGWHPDIPGYMALRDADRFDEFWGTKLVAAMSREQIEGAVKAAKFTDPRAVAYLTDTLVGRQHKLAAVWYAKVNPLDKFAIEPGGLCFDDLAVAIGLAQPAETHFAISAFDWTGAPVAVAPNILPAGVGARTCAAGLPAAADHDGYTIYKVETQRAQYGGATFVHVARDPATRQPRVIGIWRT